MKGISMTEKISDPNAKWDLREGKHHSLLKNPRLLEKFVNAVDPKIEPKRTTDKLIAYLIAC